MNDEKGRMTAERIVSLAVAQIGTKEQPAGSNCVRYNREYYGYDVRGDSYPWCCVFIWWVFAHSGASGLFYGGKKTASCGTLYAYYKKCGQSVQTPKRGDLVFFDFTGKQSKTQHIGIVEQVKADGRLVTIEGNTGNGNDANGGAVMRRTRSRKWVSGICRPHYESEVKPVTQEEFNQHMDAWLAAQAKNTEPKWSIDEGAWKKATELGIVNGARPEGFVKRDELIAVLSRCGILA